MLTIVSIHASVKDATGNWIKSREYFNVSIHASVKDATLIYHDMATTIHVSIHASVKDATQQAEQKKA